MTAPNLLDELEGVVRALEMQRSMLSEKEFPTARYWSQQVDSLSSSLIRTHHATLADMAKRLEAAERDAARARELLRKTTAVAVTVLFESERDDVLSAFPLDDLKAIAALTEPLLDANVCVESIYREAWDAATQEGEG